LLLTTDHGSIHCETPATVFAKRDATANLRYKFGEDLRAEDPEAAIMVEDLEVLWPSGRKAWACALLATGDRFSSIRPSCANTRRLSRRVPARRRDAGEMILPVALLTPRRSR